MNAAPVLRVLPSSAGVNATGLVRLLDALEADDRIEPHAIAVQRHGLRVLEGYWRPYRADDRRLVYSLSKTLTGVALALQLAERRLHLDDFVADRLPDLFEGASPRSRRMRIRHLASLTSGHGRETLLEALQVDPDPVRGFAMIEPDQEPGTRFSYEQPPVLALGRVIEQTSGLALGDLLSSRLEQILEGSPIRWERYGNGHSLAFSGAHATLDQVARLAQLLLDRGRAGGRQVLPSWWVDVAGTPQASTRLEPESDWRQGYGLMLWMSRHGFRGDGAYGQYLLVVPEHDLVVAFFSAAGSMQAVLDLLWTHLLPAVAGRTTSAAADRELERRGTARPAHSRGGLRDHGSRLPP